MDLEDNTDNCDYLMGKEVETKNPDDEKIGLLKSVDLKSSILLVIGSIIGTGIFMSPTDISSNIPSPLYSIITWIACGILALMAGLCYAELGLMYKSCGGEYVYLDKAFHPLVSFSFMFSNFFFVKPVSVAILLLFFVQNILGIVYDSNAVPYWPSKLLAVVTTILVAVLNCCSNKWSLLASDILTYSKFVCIAILLVLAIIKLSKSEFEYFSNFAAPVSVTPNQISAALYGGMWAYDGFNQIAYIVEEMKNPKKNVLLTVVISMGVIIIAYVLLIMCYITVIGIGGIISSKYVASEVAAVYLGKWSAIVSVLVSLSALGSGNATAFCGGRIYFDAARNSHLPRIVSLLHRTTKTMVPSLFIQALFTIFFLLVAPDLQTLIVYFSNAAWIYYGLTAIAVIVLRFKNKDKREFKIFILIPALVGAISLALVILGFYQDLIGTAISVGICVASIPIYFIFVFRDGLMPDCLKNGIEKFTKSCESIFNFVMPKSADEF